MRKLEYTDVLAARAYAAQVAAQLAVTSERSDGAKLCRAFIEELGDRICLHCGSPHPPGGVCQCSNDE